MKAGPLQIDTCKRPAFPFLNNKQMDYFDLKLILNYDSARQKAGLDPVLSTWDRIAIHYIIANKKPMTKSFHKKLSGILSEIRKKGYRHITFQVDDNYNEIMKIKGKRVPATSDNLSKLIS